MTHSDFIQLQKDVYRPGEKWAWLIDQFNKKNKTNLQPYLRSTYIVILSAIAQKNNWEFRPIDIQKHFPIEAMDRYSGVKRNI